MEQYGIIGKKLGHSFSPTYFNTKFQRENIAAEYVKFELTQIEAVSEVLLQPRLKGLNVTIPYKQEIMTFLDEISDEAKAVGAVNCIANENGLWKGYNTDVIGFEESLRPFLLPYHQRALVFGTGGASRAVAYVLQKLGIAYQMVSRHAMGGGLTYVQLMSDIIASHMLLINTTPLGMFPNIDECPDIPYGAIGAQHLCYDLIYNPAETLFLAKSKAQGATIVNGEAMLLAQAEAGWAIWNKKR